MDEPKDPMALWVGTWTPEDAIDVEARQLTQEPPNPKEPERGPARRDPEQHPAR